MKLKDYPLSVFTDTIHGMFERIVLCFLIIALGFGLGGITGARQISGFVAGLIGAPGIMATGTIVSIGIVILPLTVLFVGLFIRYKMPNFLLVIPLILCWYLSHDTVYWAINESPTARFKKKLEQTMNKTDQEKQSQLRVSNSVPEKVEQSPTNNSLKTTPEE